MRVLPLLLIFLAAVPVNGSAQSLGPRLAGQHEPPRVAADLEHRPAAAQPIPGASPVPAALPDAGADDAAAAAGPVRMPSASSITHRGRPMPGAVRIARNRIYDPRSGLYYWTSGAGAGEVVLP